MQVGRNTIRVFIAVLVPEESRRVLAGVMEQLRAGLPDGVNWVDPRGIHLTLKFFGDIDDSWKSPVLESMESVARRFSPFSLKLSTLGMFPRPSPRGGPMVLWVGVQGDLEALAALQDGMEQGMTELGFPEEKRPFNPHLTIGRVRPSASREARQRVAGAMTKMSLGRTEPWLVDSVHLVHSNLTPRGAIYTSLGSAPLRRPGSNAEGF